MVIDMKKNFWTGIVVGLCSAILIFVILGSVLVFALSRAEDNGKKTTKNTGDKNSTAVEEIPRAGRRVRRDRDPRRPRHEARVRLRPVPRRHRGEPSKYF